MNATDSIEKLDSYTVVLNFDARSSVLSVWHSVPITKAQDQKLTVRRAQSGIFSLSAREAEVAQHLALGESDKEIARVMAISIGTVRVHVKAIIRKLGVGNRTQAAILTLGGHPFTDGGGAKVDKPTNVSGIRSAILGRRNDGEGA